MELLAYWKLRERPFEATWDTRFFYPGRSHNEALHRLQYLVSEGSMNAGMFTGEIGCGKTLTTAVFRERLKDPRFLIAYLENSAFSFPEILAHLLREMGVEADPAAGRFALYEQFRGELPKLAACGRRLVIVLDEAQDVDEATLKDLKSLTNLNGGGKDYLTLLLIGQPELREVVSRMPPLDQRIGLRFHLHPLTRTETVDYLAFRLRAAGHCGETIFTDETIGRIHEATGGVPRELNRVAKLALEHSWVHESPLVARASVETVVRDWERHQLSSAP
ncbi:MAG: AAA family ATPase [Verrucomicrobiae bacterium]|nr:AAA family ATPase [Verrucomicrobiae bacterium]